MTPEKKIYSDEHWVSHEQMQILEQAEIKKYEWNPKWAMELLNEILYDNPWCIPALEEIADCQLTIWEDEKALKTAQFINSLTTKSYTSYYLTWFIMWKNKNFKESIKFLQQANKLNPNNPEVLRCYGWSLFMLWETWKWISLIERAKNLLSDDTQILNDLAVCKIQTWKIEEWIQLLSDVQEIDPWNQRANHTISFLKNNIKKIEKETSKKEDIKI
jgi:tetratricopeptide (TPR) repeat protein